MRVARSRRRGPSRRQPARLDAHGLGQPIRAVDGRRATGEAFEQPAQLGPEDRVLAEGVVRGFELLEGGHEGLGDVAAAEVALHPPAPGAIRVEQARRHRRRPERRVRTIVTGGPSPLDEERDEIGVLDRAPARLARELDARRDVDPERRDVTEGAGDIGRREAAGQRDRQLAGDGGGQGGRCPLAGPAWMLPAGRVEQQPFRAGRQVRLAAPGEASGGRGQVGRWLGGQVEHLPHRSTDGRDRLDRLAAVELDGVGIERRHDGREVLGRRVCRDRHEARSRSAAHHATDRPGQLGRLVERERAGRPGHQVQAQGVGTGRGRRDGAPDVGDPADLHERPAGDVGRIGRGGARRDEGPGRAIRMG